MKRTFQSDLNQQRSFLDRIGKFLSIKQLGDWYHIKVRDVIRYRGAQSLLAQVKLFSSLLK
jgi:hypothetical protein